MRALEAARGIFVGRHNPCMGRMPLPSVWARRTTMTLIPDRGSAPYTWTLSATGNPRIWDIYMTGGWWWGPRVLAIVVNYWDALDCKREMSIIPTPREVYYRDGDGQTWDLAIQVPKRFDPASYEWGSRLAMAGFWPGASLLWPICERGQLSAVMPPGQQPPPDWGGSQRVFWYSDRPLPRAVGRWPREVRGAQVVIIDGPGGLPARRLVWLITYGPPLRYMGLYETRDSHDRWLVRRLQDMLLATLRMAGYQPWVTYQLLALALRPSR